MWQLTHARTHGRPKAAASKRRTPIWTRHNKNYKLCDGYQMRLPLGNQSIHARSDDTQLDSNSSFSSSTSGESAKSK